MLRWLLALCLSCPAGVALADGEGAPPAAKKPKHGHQDGKKPHRPPKKRPKHVEPDARDTEADTRELHTVFFGGREHTYGFELSGTTTISKVLDANTRFVSGGVGLIVDHENAYGLSYSRLAAPLGYREGGADLTAELTYWGVDLAGIIDWDDIVNNRASLFVGSGTLTIGPDDAGTDGEVVSRPVYVLEPRWGAYFNVLPFLRFGLDVSYRFVAVDAQAARGEQFSGIAYTVALRGGML